MEHGTSVIMLFLFSLARYPSEYTSIPVFQHADAITTVGRVFCTPGTLTASLCKIPAHLLAGFDDKNINYISPECAISDFFCFWFITLQIPAVCHRLFVLYISAMFNVLFGSVFYAFL
uniref:Uncharacterized protein n=1 Tax=Megaselia scalaris TaxID=36166 RepID=T1GX17_MEGSC